MPRCCRSRDAGGAPALGGDRDEQVLGAGVLVLEPLGFLLGGRRSPAAGAAEKPTCDAAVRARQPVQLGAHRRRQRRRIRVHLADDLRDDAFLLLEQRQQQVLGQDLGVPFAVGELLRGEDRFLRFLGVLVDDSSFTVLARSFAQRLVVLVAAPWSASGGAGRRPWRTDRPASSGLPTTGMPWPLRRNTWPLCVVSGILSRTDPVIVGTCASPPRTAVVTGSATFVCRSSPLRSNTGCGRDLHAQVEVAGGAAVGARFALAGGADARAVLDAGRNAHVDAARVAALLDRDPARRAVERLFERQLDRVLDVAALLVARRAPRPRPRPAVARPPPPPKNVLKKSENGSWLPKSSCISSSVIVR